MTGRIILRTTCALVLLAEAVATLGTFILYSYDQHTCRYDECEGLILHWIFWGYSQVILLPLVLWAAAFLFWDRKRRRSLESTAGR